MALYIHSPIRLHSVHRTPPFSLAVPNQIQLHSYCERQASTSNESSGELHFCIRQHMKSCMKSSCALQPKDTFFYSFAIYLMALKVAETLTLKVAS